MTSKTGNDNGAEHESVIEDIYELEKEIALADYDLLKEQVKRFDSLYAKRDQLVAKIPNFWLRVFEVFFEQSMATPNIEDFELLSHLTSLKVVRDPKDPKEVDFIFTFEANEYLEDASLTITKSFSNIQSPDTQADVTSKKVPIQWKAGKDLTQTAKGAPASFFTWFAFEGNGNDEFDEGADIAMELADEIYPHAQKIFLETFVGDSDEEDEEEELDESDGEDEDEDEEEDGPPPAKKRHTHH